MKKSLFNRFLEMVEVGGNKLPHPVTLFALFGLMVIVLSGVASWFDLSVTDPRPEGARGRSADGMITVVNLFSGYGLRRLAEQLVTNFTGFVPLGTVLVALLGVGVAEASGLITASIRSLVVKVATAKSRYATMFVTMTIVFSGVLSNTASEMGYVVLIPLAGVVFHALGRHPLAGMAAAFAGVSGGYSANLLIGTIDPLLAGLTEEAARLIDPGYTVHAAVNLYFMMGSTFLVTLLGTWVTDRIIEPRLGVYDPTQAKDKLPDTTIEPLTPGEIRGLKMAGWSMLAVSVLLFLSVYPDWGVLRDPDTGDILHSPFMRGLVAIIFVFFLVPGIVYGRVTGSLKTDKDIINGMSASMSSLGLYIVLVFFAAQFVALFGWSNLGPIIAVKGAETLKALGLTGPEMFIPFILLCAFINLFMGSASAKWAILAPVFVPMLMLIGYSPEVTQTAFRIGDSTTNIITPMMSYFGLILAFVNKYDRNLGIGTIISLMLPYTLFFLAGWIIFFLSWVFGFGIPVGPGAPTFYPG
jgi:aminobenzoyl-glutamate transport protein